MSAPNRNTLWARALVDELVRCGVRHACLAPGSRSTPLVLALSKRAEVTLHTHLDERSAAFFALGVGKATGTPAAVVTTSGTAAANLYPAIIEAAQAEVPLLALTADRPPRLRGSDANQVIDQVELYAGYPRAFFELAPPSADGPALRHLRQVACRAADAACGPPAGPVHLNVPFAKPLEPTEVPGDVPDGFEAEHPLAATGRPDGAAFLAVRTGVQAAPPDAVEALAQLVATSSRGLIVAGPHPDPGRLGPAVLALARSTGYPVLADPLSGARFGTGATGHAVAGYDLFLREAAGWPELTPDLVLRVGATPTSKHVHRYLEVHNGCRHVLVDAGARDKDHLALATDHVRADAPATLDALAERAAPVADKGWADGWRSLEATTQATLADALKEDLTEGAVLREAVSSLQAGHQLFVSNSMPVRDLDAFAPAGERGVRVLGNRGASGIDGVTSTALGAGAEGTPTLAVLGDLAFLHDLNGLHAARREALPVTFLVVDNDGGGIFHMLPIREHEPAFTEHFATPHGMDLTKVGDLFELPLTRVASRAELGKALADPPGSQGPNILVVETDREENRAWHEAVAQQVTEAIRETRSNGGTP